MANIGLTTFRWARLTEGADGTPTYDGAKAFGKAISCSADITSNSAMLYADDALAESDTSFQSGTLTAGVADDDLSVFAPLLGHTIEGGAVVSRSDDFAPYVGFGRVITKMVNGAYKYKVEFFYKVKFSEPSASNSTKGESVEFSTPEISGIIAALKNKKWSEKKQFDDQTTAIAYLEGLLGSAQTTYTVTFNENSVGYIIGEAPTTMSCHAGESVTLLPEWAFTSDDGALAGWAKTSTATEPDYAPGATYTPSGNVTLYAVIAQ